MQQKPSWGPASSRNKRVERLFFPKYGDSHIFLQCGKKHFESKGKVERPFAESISELEYQSLLKHNLLNIDDIQGTKPDSNLCEAIKNRLKSKQFTNNKMVFVGKHQHQDILDQPLQKYYPDLNLKKQTLQTNINGYNRKQRVKTQIQTQKQHLYYSKKDQTGQQRYSSNLHRQERLKTEVDLPSTHRNKWSRLNPTFLSSINY